PSPPAPRPSKPAPPWKPAHSLALAALILAGLAWRLAVALRAPWYWDEGYMAELARALGHWGRPQAGGLWEDGFFPLSTSLLAPLSAAPLANAPWWTAMTGVRLWAVLLEALSLGLLARLAHQRASPWRALAAAAAYALLSFAAEHGGRGFYHHLAVPLVLATLLAGQAVFENPGRGPWRRVSFCAGLAVAACYWLWWLPLSWAVLLAWRRPQGWRAALPWAAAAPVAAVACNLWPDPAGGLWSVRCLLATSSAGGPHGLAAWAAALGADLAALPFLAVGLLGLAVAAWKDGGRWGWFLACLACAVLEPVRQRGDIAGMPYPFLLAAPLAALGAGYLAVALAPRPSVAARGALLLAALAYFKPVDLGWMRLWSFDPAPVAELKGYLAQHARPGDLVCGLPEFNWDLRPEFKVCEPFDVGAAEGRVSGFFLANAPASRFAGPCRLGALRYAVLSRVQMLGAFRFEGVALTFLEMEQQGWPLVHDNGTFKLYENPAFGATADPAARLLLAPQYYQVAADQALRAGRPDLAAFARSRPAAAP
ncbi:MAG TPA: hypothetical protein VNZ54_00585, partial [bacterium]|nr:hypothetical protein [bacterium]